MELLYQLSYVGDTMMSLSYSVGQINACYFHGLLLKLMVATVKEDLRMPDLLVALVPLLLGYFLYRCVGKSSVGQKEAVEESRLLRRWIIEQSDNCSMSDAKWRELLPLCRFADERMIQFCYFTHFIGNNSCESLVRQLIEDEEEPEETSA
jgi:hypothetical protein